MTAPDDPLWQRLAAYEFGPGDAALSFTARLARENRWSEGHAARVIAEYRRFCWLAVSAGHAVTPCDAVDQAWHLHLAYSRDYWDRFCPDVLQRPLHHGPTAGGAAEAARYHEHYAQTLRSYQAAFGPPPPDIWSSASLRFGEQTRAFRMLPGAVLLWRDRRGFAVLALLLLAAVWAGVMIGRLW